MFQSFLTVVASLSFGNKTGSPTPQLRWLWFGVP